MIRIFRVFTTFSIVLFLAILLIVYAFLPDPVGIMFSGNGKILSTISRNSLFYSFLGVFFLIQLLFYLFRTYVLNNWFGNPGKRYLISWFRGMFIMVNIFFILSITFLGFANNAFDYTYTSIVNLALAGPLLLFIWLLLLPVFYFLSTQKGQD